MLTICYAGWTLHVRGKYNKHCDKDSVYNLKELGLVCCTDCMLVW